MFSFLFCCTRDRFLFVCAVWIICSVLHIACLQVCSYSLNYVLLCLVLAVCFHLFHEFIHLLCPYVCSILSFFVRGPGSSCDLTALSTNIFDLNLYLSYVQFCFIVVVWCVCVCVCVCVCLHLVLGVVCLVLCFPPCIEPPSLFFLCGVLVRLSTVALPGSNRCTNSCCVFFLVLLWNSAPGGHFLCTFQSKMASRGVSGRLRPLKKALGSHFGPRPWKNSRHRGGFLAASGSSGVLLEASWVPMVRHWKPFSYKNVR